MPFVYHAQPIRELRKYHNLGIRDSPKFDRLILPVLRSLPESYIAIINFKSPDRKNLAQLCKERGVNLLELESWLDAEAIRVDWRVRFDKTGLCAINEKGVYYRTPAGMPSDGLYLHMLKK